MGKNWVYNITRNKYVFSKFKYFGERFLITILSTIGPWKNIASHDLVWKNAKDEMRSLISGF